MRTNPVSKSFDGRRVLDVGSLELRENTIYALIGANGSGKSTFCRILAGLLPSDNGLPPMPEAVKTGYLPQRPYVFHMSTEKNLRITGQNPSGEEELLKKLKLDSLRRARAEKLSGGETARMALARVLMRPCSLLILDEPSAAMDMESTALCEQAVLEYREKTGAVILLVTHSIRQAARIGEELLFFFEGGLKETGSCRERLALPETPELRHFLDFYG